MFTATPACMKDAVAGGWQALMRAMLGEGLSDAVFSLGHTHAEIKYE